MVHDSEHAVSLGQTAADVANFGLIRPPFVYLGSIGLGLLVHLFWPVQLLPVSVGVPIGVMVVFVAGALFISAVRTFRKAGTSIPGNRPTTTIVRTGPYRFSRNPIYLAFTLFQIGLAAWVNSLGLLLALFPRWPSWCWWSFREKSATSRLGFPPSTCRTCAPSVAGYRRARTMPLLFSYDTRRSPASQGPSTVCPSRVRPLSKNLDDRIGSIAPADDRFQDGLHGGSRHIRDPVR